MKTIKLTQAEKQREVMENLKLFEMYCAELDARRIKNGRINGKTAGRWKYSNATKSVASFIYDNNLTTNNRYDEKGTK